ncbi:hypothetical protein NDU88_004191 [Pleurodeles waltl]|uniref:Reverse transcriptase domain-containing protein n=1 Tax=Pleurodeles waltl TaxID=8319 RepID=A0AAV7LQ77_PLEWA|nr:hypothetical protein NDU88_004191 [Pleurodeles waltl]
MLAWLLREDRPQAPIGAIRVGMCEMATTQVEINETFRNYYSNLYTKRTSCTATQIEAFLADSLLPQLPQTDRDGIETPITIEEIELALAQLPRNKALGADGLPSEYYKAYLPSLKSHLLGVFQEAWTKESLPISQREAMIVVLPKQGRDHTDVKSYRPLSLLNTDCKILGKILANRLAPLMHLLIHVDQNGFIPKRNTFLNIRRLLSIIGDTPKNAQEEMVLSLDIEKAFDTLEWDFLMACMGIGPNYIRWVRTLYSNPSARVKSGGVISDSFPISRGTRQGCPLSPLLFAIAMEPLAAKIRLMEREWGIIRNGLYHTISLYADDALIYIRNGCAAIPPVISLLAEFGGLSGLVVNWEKSCVFPLAGRASNNQDPPEVGHLKWCPTTFKYLGINIYHATENLRDGNLGKALTSIKGSLQFWNKLPLSPPGKVAIANMLILPRLLYYFVALPITIPKSFWGNLNTALLRLIWGGGRARVALTTLQCPLDNGGLGTPNFERYYAAAQLQWVQYWIHRPEQAEPMSLEPRRNGTPLVNWLTSKPHKVVLVNPLLATAHACWAKYVQKGADKLPYSPHIPLNYLLAGTAAGMQAVKLWSEAGIQTVGDCFEDGKLMTFEALQALTEINPGQFLTYHAVCHEIRKIWGIGTSEPETSPVLHQLLQHSDQTKIISNLYRILNKTPEVQAGKAWGRWNAVLPTPLPLKDWPKALSHIRGVSRNPRFRYTQFNYTHQTYLSPARIKRMFPDSVPICPRCKTPSAPFYHMVWNCPNIQTVWEEVVGEVSRLMGLALSADPESCLLGLRKRPKKQRHLHKFIDLAFLMYKRLIAMHWKAPKAPDLKSWYSLIIRGARTEYQVLKRMVREGRQHTGCSTWEDLVTKLEAKNDEMPP